MTERPIHFTLNGALVAVAAEPRLLLADLLRGPCGQTGTHLGCEHGVCGACTVLVDGVPVRSCLMFGVQAEGTDIRTVEGLAEGEALSLLQQEFWNNHALQCGFCTPGFLMLAHWLLNQPGPVDAPRLRDVLSANLCRCTGYQNILAAVESTARKLGKWAE